MPLYFLVGTLTQEGQRMLASNPDVAVEAIRAIEVDGAAVLGQYAVLGRYDFILLAQAHDNEAVARLSLDIGIRMGLHVETLPAMAIGVLTDDDSDEDKARTERRGSSPEEWRLPRSGPDAASPDT